MEYNLLFNISFLLPPQIILLTKLFSPYGTCGKPGMITDSTGRLGPIGRYTMQCKRICPHTHWAFRTLHVIRVIRTIPKTTFST
jgi:hypothetical protein